MLTDDINKRLKEILNSMNLCETNLEEFYETMERETGGKITFTAFKNHLDKFYGNINKSNNSINKLIEFIY